MKDTHHHDLSLGKWGPYNKQYLGACHIANEEHGATFAVELFPAFYRRRIVSASTLIDGDVRIWGANAERTSFCYRYELEWKDKVYCDVHFNITDDSLVNIDCEFVNNMDTPESVNIFLAAGLEYPTKNISAVNLGYKEISEAEIPADCLLLDAVDYSEIFCNQIIAQDGKYLGETEADFSTGKGTLLSGAVLSEKNHFVKYSLPEAVSANSIGIRYKADADVNILMSINGKEYRAELKGCCGFGYFTAKIPEDKVSEIVLKPLGRFADVDCIAIGKDVSRVRFSPYKREFKPVVKTVGENSMLLKYADSEYTYKIEWDEDPLMLRTLYTDDVGVLLHRTIHNHIASECIDGKKSEGVYEIIRTNPIYLEPHSKAAMSFRVISERDGDALPASNQQKEIYKVSYNSDGEKYAFSQNMMAYNTLLNVVYPIYTRRGYIRHSAPGRIWNCLYTWDSGFIGMGLSTVEFKSAYENLKAYLTPVGDRHSPYIFHGSVVPTQFFLYLELLNKYPEKKEELREIYPMMMQYYMFFSDMSKGKEQTKSGVLKTWHIFYNSGGWDDYPAQRYIRCKSGDNPEQHNAMTTPVITTALAVLIAKIMKNISAVLGIDENNALFDNDIERYSAAIQNNLWDDEAGYYSYLEHDSEGNPTGFLRYEDGSNYNMGLDGAYPYIAGISNEHQSERLLDHLKNGMMTKYGLGVVDTRAPYYTPHGYWNGSVWMPHQWILAKALLDRGEIDFACKIAKTAISVWKREVDRTYLCFEHFMSQNGRGAGFHQFSGLSTPVLMFYQSLYTPGTVTAGFGNAIASKEWNNDKTKLRVISVSNSKTTAMIVCMNEKCKYKFTCNGKNVRAKKLTGGAYAIKLGTAGKCVITVEAK